MKLFKSTEKLLGFVHAKESLLVNYNHIRSELDGRICGKQNHQVQLFITPTKREKITRSSYNLTVGVYCCVLRTIHAFL